MQMQANDLKPGDLLVDDGVFKLIVCVCHNLIGTSMLANYAMSGVDITICDCYDPAYRTSNINGVLVTNGRCC